MDFSQDLLRHPTVDSTLSNDTMDHATLVMACRFGWTQSAGPNHAEIHAPVARFNAIRALLATHSSEQQTKRFVPCRGRLYHQLACSHRIRTDVVEDCGPNCLDSSIYVSNPPFYCHECFEHEAVSIYNRRKAEHSSTYPPSDQMRGACCSVGFAFPHNDLIE